MLTASAGRLRSRAGSSKFGSDCTESRTEMITPTMNDPAGQASHAGKAATDGAFTHEAKAFYDREFAGKDYTPESAHANGIPELGRFVSDFGLIGKKVLEVGCGRGVYQDLVPDWTGTDIADSVRPYIRKPFVQGSADRLAWADNSFDAAWTIWCFEHVPELEQAMAELRRVIKPGGVLFFCPAWQCRSWFADGYPVRPYSDFGLGGKLIKASIPIRNSVAWRAMFMFPRRLWRAAALASGGPLPLRYRKIRANYETFWMSDSDACNSIDPFEAMVWFRSRGDEVVSPRGALRQFLFRTGPVIVRIRK
jgi:SAM-dependent methyltransferase